MKIRFKTQQEPGSRLYIHRDGTDWLLCGDEERKSRLRK